MKKIVSLLLALTLLVSCAFAEVLTDGTVTVTVPDTMESYALEEDDIEDGMYAYYEGDNLAFAAYCSEADGYTLEDLLAEETEYAESDSTCTLTQSGNTEIANQTVLYIVDYVTEDSEAYYYVSYNLIVNGNLYEFVFWMFDTSANDIIQSIMNSLTVA